MFCPTKMAIKTILHITIHAKETKKGMVELAFSNQSLFLLFMCFLMLQFAHQDKEVITCRSAESCRLA